MPVRNVAFALRGLHDALAQKDAKEKTEEPNEQEVE